MPGAPLISYTPVKEQVKESKPAQVRLAWTQVREEHDHNSQVRRTEKNDHQVSLLHHWYPWSAKEQVKESKPEQVRQDHEHTQPGRDTRVAQVKRPARCPSHTLNTLIWRRCLNDCAKINDKLQHIFSIMLHTQHTAELKWYMEQKWWGQISFKKGWSYSRINVFTNKYHKRKYMILKTWRLCKWLLPSYVDRILGLTSVPSDSIDTNKTVMSSNITESNWHWLMNTFLNGRHFFLGQLQHTLFSSHKQDNESRQTSWNGQGGATYRRATSRVSFFFLQQRATALRRPRSLTVMVRDEGRWSVSGRAAKDHHGPDKWEWWQS